MSINEKIKETVVLRSKILLKSIKYTFLKLEAKTTAIAFSKLIIFFWYPARRIKQFFTKFEDLKKLFYFYKHFRICFRI